MPASRAAGSTRPRRKILSGASLVLALLASLIAFTSSPVDAVAQEKDDECYVEVVKHKYERGDRGQEEILNWQKQTRTEKTGRFSGTVYDEGTWEDWPSDPVSVEPNPMTGEHGSSWTSGVYRYQRYFQYRVIEVQEFIPDTYEDTGWLTEPPDQGDGPEWTVKKGPKTFKGETFPCPSAEATPGTCEAPGEITPSTSEHYTHEIEDGAVTFTAVSPAVFGGDVQTVFDFSEKIAQLEGEECDEEVTAVDPDVTQSEQCEVEGELVIPNTGGVQYLLNDEPIAAGSHEGPISGTLTADALDGHKLTNPEWSFEVDIPAAEDCPPPPPPPEDPEDPVVSASVGYVCDADATVTFSSTDGASDFVVEVNGETVHTETLEGTNQVGIIIAGTTSVIVRADGDVVINEDVEFVPCDDSDTLGADDELEVGGVEEVADEEAAPTSLPRTGASSDVLALVAALTLGFGATLRTVSRKLR